MNKIIVKNNVSDNEYLSELTEASMAIRDAECIDISELSIEFVKKKEVDVIISNGLSKEWYFILRDLKIVTVTIDSIANYSHQADIVIDFKCKDDKKYLTGKEYSVRENKDFNLLEIVDLIRNLDWDSDFFGFPIAYLSSHIITDSVMFRIDKYVKSNNIKLIEYLCNCHDYGSVLAAENHKFHFADIRLTFERSIQKHANVVLPEGFYFGKAEERHVGKLKNIAENLYLDSRYYFDKNFDIEKTNIFYQNWVEKAVLGTFDNECYCVFVQDEPVGFCTIRYSKSNNVNIGLFGIDNQYQGIGLGKNILFLVFNELNDKQIEKIFVVTQGRNYPAQRIYQSVGFLTKSTELWYHKWN